MNISEVSIKRSTIPIVILIISLLCGLFLGSKLKYELIPDISTPVIVVSTVYPGAGSEDIEKSVTIPIEDVLARLEGVDEIISASMEGVSIVRLMMDMDVDPDIAIQDAQAKIDRLIKDLPEDVRSPSLSRVDLSELPIITLGATSNETGADFFSLIDDEIQPSLSQISGVANVNTIGGLEKEIKVNVDKDKLASYNIPLPQVVQMVGAANMELPAGKIETRSSTLKIRLAGKYKSIDQLRNTTIGYTNTGEPIVLSEIADVYNGIKDVKTIAKINGEVAIGIEISKQKEANAVEVSKLVNDKLIQLSRKYENINLKFSIANDNSVFTLEAAKSVGVDLVLAIVLVSLIMLLFLRSFRNSLFVLITIPTSLISTLTAMYLFDFSLDLISLASLSLVVGTVVDDAIVIIENIHRHMEMGKDKLKATSDSMKEIGLTLVSTTAVLAAVFIPIALVTGITGQILREYAVTIVAAMVFSLLFTFTLVPLLTSRYAKIEHAQGGIINKWLDKFEALLDKMAAQITQMLKWSLNHKLLTISIVLIFFFLSIYLIPAGFIGASFMDAGDRGNSIVRLELNKDTPLKKNMQLTAQAEQVILSRPEVSKLYTTIGKRTGGNVSAESSTPYYTEFNVVFVPVTERELSSNILSRIIRSEIEEQVPGVKVTAANVNMLGNEDIPIQVFLKGNNVDSVYKASGQVVEILSSIKGTTEVENSLNMGTPELQVMFDRDKLAHYGLTVAGVSRDIRLAFDGNTSNKFRVGEKEYDINIKYDGFNRKNISDLKSLTFSTQLGEVSLNQFADVKMGNGPSVLERYNRTSSANVKCQLVGTSQGAVQQAFEVMVEGKLPQGVTFNYSTRTKMMAKSFASLGVAFAAAIVFMYLIMVLLYNNWLHPFVVLFTIPLAIIGALFALALAGANLSLFTILGIIMLSGLVAKNAILVIDFANELLSEGKTLIDAVCEAVLLRFRAILMTNISMIIGLIPLAISSGAGAEWKNGIGWVLIGGLTVSMFLSMIIVPMIYYVLEKLKVKYGKHTGLELKVVHG